MISTTHLGYFELTELISVLFQFTDDTGAFAVPDNAPLIKIYKTDGTLVTPTPLTMTTNVFTGMYKASIDPAALIYNGDNSALDLGRYLIFIYASNDAPTFTNSSYNYVDLVDTGANIATQGAVLQTLDGLYAPVVSTGTLAEFVEDSVWDADPA